ncbi:TlpA disulfide reductase family protein [Halobacteriovorax sp. JY17]|uniref:TlpA family protein disulfide reductase n=1 Tax=Halobacteriovorax sp. JY17 TaxID=2014617 RepID=UPI000C50E516|nr:TlpA disulfide reductase family protein [Halobacteriovorax sp. JY17]PIK14295.1 MAG: hypothetical protein CES88_15075 [Halobacteriovorax sp. JY17]
MKKYFPIYIALAFLTVLGVGQGVFNLFDLKADATKVEKKVFTHYESLYNSLELKTTENKKIKLKEIKAPIVVINFWATWCKPCLIEFPSIVKMKEKYDDSKVMVLGVNQDDEDQMTNIKKIVKKYKLNFQNIADTDGSILEKFMVSAIPVSIIFHKGKVIQVSNGAKDFSSEEVYEKFDKLLKN